MYGIDISSLVIYTSTKSNPMTEVARRSGEQGNQWMRLDTDIGADIGITLQNNEWLRIIIEAIVGAGFQGRKIFFFNHFCLSLFS